MKSYQEFITELSNKTLNSYLDKSATRRKELVDKEDYDAVKQKLRKANIAVDKINKNNLKRRPNTF